MKTPETEWIPWNGNEDRPVPKGTVVDIKFRCGEVRKSQTPEAYFWKAVNGTHAISAYRIISQPALQPPAWSLTEYLSTHWPDWGDRKPHREDFTEEMLTGGWRPLFEGEPVVDGEYNDELRLTREAPTSFHWQKNYSKPPAPEHFWRTHRALPAKEQPATVKETAAMLVGLINSAPAKEEPWYPQPNEPYEVFNCGVWCGPYPNTRGSTAAHHESTGRKYRPAVPPKTIQTLSEELIQTILQSPNNEPENTMNQTLAQSAASPAVELPAIGSRWGVAHSEGPDFTGTVKGAGPDGISFLCDDKDFVVFPLERWGRTAKSPLPTKRDRRQSQPLASRSFGPSLYRRLRNYAACILLGIGIQSGAVNVAYRTTKAFCQSTWELAAK